MLEAGGEAGPPSLGPGELERPSAPPAAAVWPGEAAPLLGRARPPGRGAGGLLAVPGGLWPWGLCLAPAVSAWPPAWPPAQRGLPGPPLTPSFCSSTWLCSPSSGKTQGERGTRGRGRGLGTTTPLEWQSLGKPWDPLRALRGGRALRGQTDAGVGSASEFGLGDSFRQDISMSHRLGSRGSRVG